MTKDKKPSRMPVSEKRRSAAALAHAAVARAASPSPSPSPFQAAQAPRGTGNTTMLSAPSPERNTTGGGGGIIAPPPRAQLGSSNPPEDETYKEPAPAVASAAVTTAQKELRENSAPAGGSPPSAAATAALLRDRDQRIADLERELRHSAGEFAQLLDGLSQKESDASTYWQGRHEQAAAQAARAEAEMDLLRAEVEVRDAEKQELTAVWEALTGRLSEREREAAELRAQVRGLKEFVSTSTRTDGQAATSDEVFGDGMGRLGNGLQNWVIVHFRKAKLDIQKAGIDVQREVEELVPMCGALAKVHLLQSLVSRILVDMVFSAYYVGLSDEQARQFREMEAVLSSLGSRESVNQWRSATLTLLRREVDAKWQAETEAAASSVVERVNRLLDAITDVQRSEARDNALRAQVTGAIELSRLLAVQKAVFVVHMPVILPHQQTLFDAVLMEDVGGEDEEALAQREISCVTFPGIIKHGDEGGASLHYRNVISKVRVLCSPE